VPVQTETESETRTKLIASRTLVIHACTTDGRVARVAET
jgi:hypothetical protein